MKLIKLTKGYFTKIYNEDYEKFYEYKWHTSMSKSGPTAKRNTFINGKRKIIILSREIMNCPKGMEVDHINGDTLDNRKNNLRICTHMENTRNRKISKKSISGFKGVSWSKGHKKWLVQITKTIEGKEKNYFLGYFHIKEAAAIAYDKGAIKHYGSFAKLNFPI